MLPGERTAENGAELLRREIGREGVKAVVCADTNFNFIKL